MTKLESKTKYAFYLIGLISGVLGVVSAFVAFGFSVCNQPASIYTLAASLFLLGINRTFFHLSDFKKNMFMHILLTITIYALAVLVLFTNTNLYLLIGSMFLYSVTIVVGRIIKLKDDHSLQSIIFSVLISFFVLTYSFIFFFPAIYEKHATSVDNWSFIILSYSVIVIVSCFRNIVFPYHKVLKLNIVKDIIKKTMLLEILTFLLDFTLLCSIYFTLVEQNITSFADALWYSFSVITTIGFGDVYVTTTFGRIISVILGIFGIVIIAVFTSLIVNFYNEINKRRESKQIKKLEAENKKLEQEFEESKEQSDK